MKKRKIVTEGVVEMQRKSKKHIQYCINIYELILSFLKMALDKEKTLKEILDGMSNSSKWKDKLHETKVREVWNEKMGTTINHYTKGIKLRNDRLFITIDSASLRQEMTYEREKIKEMMNRELGGDFIKDVMIR